VIELSKPKGLEIGKIGLKSLIEKSPNKFTTSKLRLAILLKKEELHNICRILCLNTHLKYS
jgi:hypothetical protein